jgi:hypothetical protein
VEDSRLFFFLYFLQLLEMEEEVFCIQVWEKEGTAHKKEIGQWLQGEFVDLSPSSLTSEVIFRIECWPCTGLNILLNKFSLLASLVAGRRSQCTVGAT